MQSTHNKFLLSLSQPIVTCGVRQNGQCPCRSNANS